MSTMSDIEKSMMSKNGEDSPFVVDANNGGNVGGNGSLKKGPWTTAEDAVLVEYVTKHGEGNWNAVQKHLGLARCGKSCRLRWANHLRPDLKKGAFTSEEECCIIELHAKMGNKWARMAAELPGRTDNEIKNYWNTRIKRRQRAGLPIYPPDMCLQVLNENQQSDAMRTFSSMDAQNPDFLPINNFEIPEFKGLELNQQLYSPALFDIPPSSWLDIPVSSMLAQSLHSSHPNKPLLSTVHPPLQGSESLFHGLNPSVSNIRADEIQYHSDDFVQIAHSFIFSSACDYSSTSDRSSSSSVLPGSHAVLNGNPSSEPAWAMKLELPSLQTQMGIWGSPSSPLPSLDSVDTLIQTPPSEHTQSCNLSTQNSGLLDAVLYESQTMKISKKNYHRQTSHASDMNDDIMDTSSQGLHKAEWEAYGESVSPLGHSSLSVFTEYTIISGNSWDEPKSVEIMPGYKVKEATNLISMQYDDNAETTNKMIFSRPDFLLASNSFGQNKDPTKDHSLLKDALGSLLGDDLCKDCKQIDTSAISSAHSHGHNSNAWNAMSIV